jgi:Kef-type K+ transport system membrane component KefB
MWVTATAAAPVLLGLVLVLVAAKAGQEVAGRLRQSPVLGEILAGVALGNLSLLGVADPAFLRSDVFEALAEIGIVLLLFEIGVETTVAQMRRTGIPALLVAVVGVAAPLALGSGVSWLFFPRASVYAHLFVGAILCATSVGITARVLVDLGLTRTPEARLVLGAAVIDDVLGLILLAVVSGLVVAADAGATLGVASISWIALKALLFLGLSIPLGLWIAPRLFALAARLRAGGVLLAMSLAFCFLFAYAGTVAGLAPIVGAFAAGLVLEERHFQGLASKEAVSLEQTLKPLTSLLLPVFFVLIGMKVDARSFADPRLLAFAGVLLLAALAGKLACALVVRAPVDRWAVGLGMVPRGEVGFIFAGIGTTLSLGSQPLVPPLVFAASVLVVIVTTLLVPPLLTARFRRLRPLPDPTSSPRAPVGRDGRRARDAAAPREGVEGR